MSILDCFKAEYFKLKAFAYKMVGVGDNGSELVFSNELGDELFTDLSIQKQVSLKDYTPVTLEHTPLYTITAPKWLGDTDPKVIGIFTEKEKDIFEKRLLSLHYKRDERNDGNLVEFERMIYSDPYGAETDYAYYNIKKDRDHYMTLKEALSDIAVPYEQDESDDSGIRRYVTRGEESVLIIDENCATDAPDYKWVAAIAHVHDREGFIDVVASRESDAYGENETVAYVHAVLGNVFFCSPKARASKKVHDCIEELRDKIRVKNEQEEVSEYKDLCLVQLNISGWYSTFVPKEDIPGNMEDKAIEKLGLNEYKAGILRHTNITVADIQDANGRSVYPKRALNYDPFVLPFLSEESEEETEEDDESVDHFAD